MSHFYTPWNIGYGKEILTWNGLNFLSANPTGQTHSNIRLLPTNCFSVFNHSVELALKISYQNDSSWFLRG